MADSFGELHLLRITSAQNLVRNLCLVPPRSFCWGKLVRLARLEPVSVSFSSVPLVATRVSFMLVDAFRPLFTTFLLHLEVVGGKEPCVESVRMHEFCAETVRERRQAFCRKIRLPEPISIVIFSL